jgi:hypothetical protein
MKDYFERWLKSILVRSAKGLVNKAVKDLGDEALKKTKVEIKSKSHPWRQCPIGEHWVVTHQMKVPISNNNPDGLTTRKEHCALNPKRNKKVISDYIEPEEIDFIAEKYFGTLTGPPAKDNLGFEDGNKYDHFIRGWTKYWNDIFKPTVPLDPNLVKALIGSESSFDTNPKAQNAGAAGIRWLFHKKKLASGKLKREATWEEGIAEYKAYSKEMIAGKHMRERGMIVIYDLYERLQK